MEAQTIRTKVVNKKEQIQFLKGATTRESLTERMKTKLFSIAKTLRQQTHFAKC